MSNKLRYIFIFLFILIVSSATAHAEFSKSPSAKELVKLSDDLMRGDSNSGTYTMEIFTPSWTRKLELKVYAQGRDKTFIRILSPAKEAGISTLRVDNEMWNYLPNIEKVIKIPPSLMLQPWMGSDFANDDLVKESSLVNDYTHRIIQTGRFNGLEIAKIELIPNPDAPVIWGRVLLWIRTSDYVPFKQAYYNERGQLVKELLYTDIGKVSDRTIPKTWTMKSKLEKDHYTVIKLVDVEYNVAIKKHIFTRSYLKRVQ